MENKKGIAVKKPFVIRRISGNSMDPRLLSGSLVLAFNKKPKIGDVVIARVDDRDVVKRVDQIDERRVFLLGDNAAASTDSRSYGFISVSAIVAVVVIKLPRLF